jgi:hypothetical protein
LKYNGGDSGIKISVPYLRCSLIRVSVIRGSTVHHTEGRKDEAEDVSSYWMTLRKKEDAERGSHILHSVERDRFGSRLSQDE